MKRGLVVLLAEVAACGAFGTSTDGSGAASVIDGGGIEGGGDAAEASASEHDADAGPACADNPIVAGFGDPRWVVGGAAAKANDLVVLAPAFPQTTGGVAWRQRHKFDAFHASVTFHIDLNAVNAPGDGFALVWTSSTIVPAIGGSGGSMGACGLKGYAIAVDLTADATGSGPRLKLFDATPKGCPDTSGVYAMASIAIAVADGADHRLDVDFEDGRARASIDGVAQFDARIPSYIAFEGELELTAANGNDYAQYTVSAPEASFPREATCPAGLGGDAQTGDGGQTGTPAEAGGGG